MGTPYYWSPERLKLKQYNQSADMWAVGIIFYMMLAKYMPFDSMRTDVIKRTEAKPLPDYVPTDIKTMISGLLQKDPEKRMTCGEAFQILMPLRYAKSTSSNASEEKLSEEMNEMRAQLERALK